MTKPVSESETTEPGRPTESTETWYPPTLESMTQIIAKISPTKVTMVVGVQMASSTWDWLEQRLPKADASNLLPTSLDIEVTIDDMVPHMTWREVYADGIVGEVKAVT